MDKILHIASTFKTHETDDGSVMIRGMASTSHADRAGDVIAAEAWTKGGLDNFKNNPIILFNHDYDKPVGRATSVNVTKMGLELEAKISKAAPANVAQLVKDGVLGAFSVGFKVKDADYVKETDGLMIKDAELFEVSVVSVPCNQAATFSLAKSFDSEDEYNEFKKTFTNRVDLAGQSLAKDEVNTSSIASDAPQSADLISADQEIKMDNPSSIDLEAFAKKVADETAAKIAMKQAETKAAEEAQHKAAAEAAEAKTLEAKTIKSTIQSGIESGVEKLEADMKADFEKAKGDEINELMKKYEADVAEKGAELEAMRNSKMEFTPSGRIKTLADFGQEALNAEILGKITGKGWDTAYAKDLMSKAVNPGSATTSVNDFAVSYTDAFEQAVGMETKLGGLFREIPMQSASLVVPFLGEVNPASFGTSGGLSGGANLLELNGETDGDLDIANRVLVAERLVAGTYIDNHVDEGQLVSFLPMINAAIARAHGNAIDDAILYGTAGATAGILDNAGDKTVVFGSHAGVGTKVRALFQEDDAPGLTAADFKSARANMGAFGINPDDLVYVCNVKGYHDLLVDADFDTFDEVGALATRVTGQVGRLYGSPVIVSDRLAGGTDEGSCAAVINKNSCLLGRLKGVSIETDYEAANQRTGIIASQSLGFKLIQAATSNIAMYFTNNA
ncbi:MAG: HK97 family phage prohead protease [Porticoccaceae bacterium]|nr:HK97 family phage prohead protease [Porticoccaceae bacterium]